MNTIRSIAALNQRELEAGTSDAASWHADYADTAYIYIGGLPYELSEGDIVSIFSQYGEPVHCNLIRDKETGKSRGFAFLKYEDQRSTNLAVDNLSGANILGRIISVDHHRYKHKEDEEKAETEAKEKEARMSSRDKDEDSRRPRKRDAEEEAEPRQEPTQKEKELVKLMRDVDDDDPMKEYMIQQKKDEIEAERALLESNKKRRKRHGESGKDRHRHRHRHRSRSRSPRRHRSRSRTERERTSEPEPAEDRRSEEREGAHGRDRSRDYRRRSRR